jgi:hypothetical protein
MTDSPDSSSDTPTTIPAIGIAAIALALLLLLLVSLLLPGFIMSQPDHMKLNDFQHFIANQNPNKQPYWTFGLTIQCILYESGLSTVCSFPDNSTKDDAIC